MIYEALVVMYADTTRWRLQTALFIRGQRSMTVNIISVYGAQYMTSPFFYV